MYSVKRLYLAKCVSDVLDAHSGPKQGSPGNVKKGKYLKVLAGLIIFRFNK